MHTETTYWSRHRNLLTRRHLLGRSLAAGAGLAGLGLVGCGGTNNRQAAKPTAGTVAAASGTPSGGAATTIAGGAAPSTRAAATAAAPRAAGPSAAAGPPPKPGGVGLVSGTPAVWDTFDTDRSNFSTNLAVFNTTFDRIINWQTFLGGAKLTGGVADKWESPDPSTYTFRVRPRVVFHDKPPVSGRAATADDIAYHITRNREAKLKDGTADPNFKRKAAYSVVDSVTVVDANTVTVKLKRPATRFLNLMAGAFEFVQAKEAVEQFEGDFNKNFGPQLLVGTGPFVFTDLKTDGTYKYRRFDKYWGNPYLDGQVALPIFGDLAARQAGFEQKQLDFWSSPTAKVFDDVKSRFSGQVHEYATYTSTMIGGYYNAGGPPWNNPKLIGALYLAFNRQQWIQQIHSGQGVTTGFVLAYQTPFNLPATELARLPGFRDYAADLADAKKMWDAGGGAALGTINVDMSDLYISQYPDAPAALQAMLKQALGNDVVVSKETYPNALGTKLPNGYYGNGKPNFFGFHYLPQPADPEPTDDMIAFFRSDQPMAKVFGVNQANGVSIAGLDDMLNKLDQETDLNKRSTMAQQIDKLLVQNYGAGVIHGMTVYSRTLAWNYYKFVDQPEQSPLPTIKSNGSNVWIDPSDASYQGRTSDKNLL